MNILIDTNIFIPIESDKVIDSEENSDLALDFYRKSLKLNYHIFLLDKQINDIVSDKDEVRRERHLNALKKYETLKNVDFTSKITQAFELSKLKSHDFIDVCLLNVVCSDAVDILVTNDNKIHKNAYKLHIEDRVYHLCDIIALLDSQLPELEIDDAHPIVKQTYCYNLDLEDHFFDSLRNDYKDFNKWFIKCKKEQRECLVIEQNKDIIGVCIYKFEDKCYGMYGKILKICTFKLLSTGIKLGELLLKKIFDYSYISQVDWIYVTCFSKNFICQFFENFGFQKFTELKEDTGEYIYRKKLTPKMTDISSFTPLEYHIKFGPKYFNECEPSFLVPIKEEFHKMLFPDFYSKNELFPEYNYEASYSNGIKKAYICKSPIKKLKEGSILFFYVTRIMNIQCCGIVEKAINTNNVNKITSLVGKRTVYSQDYIEELCKDKKDVLVILFRDTNILQKAIPIKKLFSNKLINGYPQSITCLKEETKKWILNQK